MNEPITDHPLVGTTHTYHAKCQPYTGDPDEPGLVIAHGMQVVVRAVFRNWNDVADLDMLAVRVPATGYTTHVPPRALGLGRLSRGGTLPLDLDWEAGWRLDQCSWWDVDPTGSCAGRLAMTGDGLYSIVCEHHYNHSPNEVAV